MISSLHFLTFYNSLYHNPDYQQERKKGEKKPKPTNQPNKQTNKQKELPQPQQTSDKLQSGSWIQT